MLEYSWKKTRFWKRRTRPRSRRFKTQPDIDICHPGLFLLVYFVGFCVLLCVTLLCCREQERNLVMLPWLLGSYHLVMLALKRLERNEVVDLESGGGGIEEGLAKGA
ncbi:hypothetical protein DL98DRAFT_227223 [Cadophora sp. DSE1049]|nr:hypothetical protein DL98DRAFT_227223 [Cadophora sp. DSE1049]